MEVRDMQKALGFTRNSRAFCGYAWFYIDTSISPLEIPEVIKPKRVV